VAKRFYQLSFLRDTDGEKTKEAVEAVLENIAIYMLTVPDEFLPRVTQTYSLVPPSNTNVFHSSTEIAAISSVIRAFVKREKSKHLFMNCFTHVLKKWDTTNKIRK
jgi:ArpU family phage transcriptional regulator